jgi:F5/8 type C domain
MRTKSISAIIFLVVTRAFFALGADTEVPPGRIMNPPDFQAFMGAAYNTELDEYFITYAGGGQSFARRLAPDPAGIFLSSQIVVSANAAGTNSVAYNPDDNEYLVIWRRTSGDMYGRYVSGDGVPLGSEFFIVAGAGEHDLAYGNGRYVAIHQKGPIPYTTRFSVIDADSSSSSPVLKNGVVESNAFSPRIEYGSVPNKFLIVFTRDYSPDPVKANIGGRFLSPNGTLLGDTFGIATGIENQQIPELGYSDVHDRWLVVFEDWNTGGYPDIKAHYVLGDGTVSSRFGLTRDSRWDSPGPVTYNASVDKFFLTYLDGGAKVRDVDPVDKSVGDILVLNKGGFPTAAASRPHPAHPQVFVLSREGYGLDGVHAHVVELPPPPPSFSSTSMPVGYLGTPYSEKVPVVGGTQPLTFQLLGGSLAPPLTGPNGSGIISGTPNSIGVFGPFTIKVTDADGRVAQADLTHEIKLAPPTPISPLQATNDTTPTFTWGSSSSATSHRLKVVVPGGATVLDQSGITATSYTPGTPVSPGLYQWMVSASDGVHTSPFSTAVSFEIDVTKPAAVVLTGSVPSGVSTLSGVSADSVSSQITAKGFVKENLVDGNLSTDWQTSGTSSPQNEWAILDLAGDYNVSALRLRADDGNALRFPKDFSIQTSLDKTTWATLHQESGSASNPATWHQYDFSPTVAHYLRLLVTGEANYYGAYYTRLAEMEVLQESAAFGAIEICFDAPGDDGNAGTAAAYDIAYMPGPASSFSFGAATHATTNVPTPLAAGTHQCYTIQNPPLNDETLYSIALKSMDDAGNTSNLSNIVEVSTRGVPPTTVTNLQAFNPGKTTVHLLWTPPTDAGSGVQSYDVRYSTSPITPANFDAATALTGEPTPGGGSDGSMTATGLPSNTLLYFALKSVDFRGNVSAMSNVPSVETLDGKKPSRITDLVGTSGGDSYIPQSPLLAVDASSEWTAKGYLKGNLVDSNPSTIWMTPGDSSSSATSFVTIDLGATVNVAQVSLQADDGNAKRFPRDFQIQVSNDASSGFVTVHSVVNQFATPSQWYVFDVTPMMARYVRINVTGMNRYSNGLYYTSIAEVKVTRLEVLAGGFVLDWTAPSDDFDSNVGSASSYDIRYSSADIVSNTDWNNATKVAAGLLPTPQPFGFHESLSLSGFGQEQVLYLAMKATDENGNTSDLSNSVKVATPGTPPDQVVGLAISGATGSSLTLSFTASADDGGDSGSGPVDHYDMRCRTTPINGMADFLAAPSFGGPTPKNPGQSQTWAVGPLANQTMYYCAVVAVDDADNVSPLSAVVSGSTADAVAPDQVSNLQVAFGLCALGASYDGASAEWTSKGYFGANVVDADLSTIWMTPGVSTNQMQWVVLDLGSTKSVGEVRLRSDDGNAKRFPKDFSVQTSSDKTSWTTVNTQTDFAAVPSTWYVFPFTATPARYVRILVTSMNRYSNGLYYADLAEIEVYGAGGPQIQATLSWQATGDDGPTGIATAYEVRFSTSVINDETSFNNATLATGVYPSPASPGVSQAFTIGNSLIAATNYYFGVKTSDEAGNFSITTLSGTSPNVDGSPVDLIDPDPVTDLAVSFAVSTVSLTADSASSERFDKNFVKENVVDGDLSTDWMTEGLSANQTQWIILDLGSVQTLNQVRLRSDDGNAARFPKDFAIELSTDKSTWTPVNSQAGFVATPSTWYSFPFSDTPGRYIRVLITQMNKYTNALYYAVIAEMEAVATGTTYQATLTFKATGDDGIDGQALAYDIRFSTSIINGQASFDSAPTLDGEPSPKTPLSPEVFVVPAALSPGTTYYFGVEALDEVGNSSLAFVSGTVPP